MMTPLNTRFVRQFHTNLALYNSAFYKENALVTEHKTPPSTNEIVLPASGLTCDFASFQYTDDSFCEIRIFSADGRERTVQFDSFL
jgi:hypothetical protein